ncbi:MAG TPA: peroxiredoxin [Candidatus Binataceae bacterium]|nr:peroxiredoxin [Candidatus Binataceae bacterium]
MSSFALMTTAAVGISFLKPLFAHGELLKEGQPAPPFSTQMVTADGSKQVSLADFHGKKVILYFYPKDETPGCTKEACAFRDGYARFQTAGIVVLGCSVDSAEAHEKFIKKYSLPFPLLVDTDKKIATDYGAANGIPILGFDRRITYVIGEDGKVLKAYPSVDPSIHADQILKDIGATAASAKAAPPASK